MSPERIVVLQARNAAPTLEEASMALTQVTAASVSRRNRVQLPALWALWLVTRADLYRLALVPGRDGDVGVYERWYTCCFAHGTFPLADPMWQYPPGAALVFWLPGHLPGGYLTGFVSLAIGCDLAVAAMLYAAGRRGGSMAGAWYWVCGVPLLGATAVTRFDLIPVALAVAALSVAGRDAVSGALTGAAAAVKAWPAVVLAGAPPGHWWRRVAATSAVLAAVCAVFPRETASFLEHQGARGLEIESVAATPFMIWRQAGWPGTAVFRFGAWQLSGPYVALAQDACGLGVVLVIAAVLGWRLLLASGRARWRPEFAADAPLAATLLYLVASPLLSAQFLLWVTGLAAVCLSSRRTTQWPAALAALAATALTQLIFPVGWLGLIRGSDLYTGVLTARNALLVAAAALSCWRIVVATSPRPDALSAQATPALERRP
jgi:hypothetical protein